MHWRSRFIPAVSLALFWPGLLIAEPPTTAPSTQPSALESDPDDSIPVSMTVPSIASIVKLSMQNHMLSMTTDLPRQNQETRLNVTDFPGKTIAFVGGPTESATISIRHEIWMPPNTTMIYSFISTHQNDVRISLDCEDTTELRTIQFIQATPMGTADPEEPPVKLYVSIKGNFSIQRPVDLKLTADDVVQLRRKYPRETMEYLQPLLAAVHQDAVAFAIDPREAWQVLQKNIDVDPHVADQVKALLLQLDADDYATREMASESLDKLGQPAALVVMRMPRASLSSEQNSRLDTFLSRYKPLSEADARKYAVDVPFLLDCLYTDDRALRELTIKQLRTVTSNPINLPSDAPPAIWAASVRKLQKEFLAHPTTNPSRPQ